MPPNWVCSLRRNAKSFHHPKMRQAKDFQRCLFQELQNVAQEFPERAEASNDVVVRAEDDRPLDEFYR